MKKLSEYLLAFFTGAVVYSLIELIWRGRTHWTMMITGGLCFALIYFINEKFSHRRLWEKCLASAIGISVIEFNIGCIVNILLDWHVWDYSNIAYNIMGQVCPLYSFFWFLLSIPAIFICAKMQKFFSVLFDEYQST